MISINTIYPKRAFLNNAAIASKSITVSTVAIGVAAPFSETVELVTFDVQDDIVRVRWDGTDPTSTVGHKLLADTGYTWTASQFNAAKFIRDSDSAGSATIFASPMQA